MSPIRGFDPNGAPSPLGEMIGREIIHMADGESEVQFTIDERWMNMQGILHGGAYATMLDTACGIAVRSKLDMERYKGHVTLEIKTSYFKAGTPGKYIAKSNVLRMGKRVSYIEASLFNDAGDLVSRASATFSLLLRDG
jgi:uncharacterized protein (TIGR00369 family)